ncbi:hypothetical protein BCV69DRAFT_158620 [Microstroma glucosiphilum]|uniref:Uncharacterized protein n=1 Tax=Pseudomicrostroma glucosiphilum TaxID=1684307 RepID=A0A316U9I1_9BASI|nr:hypothetical protein BCV69DRAFT_158620 [Pseudomicrostroma glucosiphilum]PWN21890.1 hypothetical protein BCV69DRAFT_158620 [Pseudomicrostroma glucosiphilum]
METLVASDDYAAGGTIPFHGDDADAIANANDAEMNAEYEQPGWEHEERMEEEGEQEGDSNSVLKPTDAFPPVVGESEEVMEYDQDASGDAAEEADEDGDIDIGEVDESADVVIADEEEQVDQEGQDDSAYEQGAEIVQEVVLDDEQEEQQHGDAPEATELASDNPPVLAAVAESEAAKLGTSQEGDHSGEPSLSGPTVGAATDSSADVPTDAPNVDSESVVAHEQATSESTVREPSPSSGQQHESNANADSSGAEGAAKNADVGGAEQAADEVEDDDQAGDASSSESWDAGEEEDEVAIEPIRLSFQDQSFAIFSADPESTSYLAWDDETDTLKTVPAPRLAVDEDVFWSPLETLFNALRVKDALGEFLEGESGSELVMTFPELELTVREDNVYAREISLTHLIRLHHQLGLRDSMHIRISEDSRFISQYNLLAQQIAQAQKQGAEDTSGEEVGAPEAEEAVASASTLPLTAESDGVMGEGGAAQDERVGALKNADAAHEEVEEASATVAAEVKPTATEEAADIDGESGGADLNTAKNGAVDGLAAQDAEAVQKSGAQQGEASATSTYEEHGSETVREADGAAEEIIEYQEEGDEQLSAHLADQEEGYVDETQEAEAEGADDQETDNVAEHPDADQWQIVEGEEEEADDENIDAPEEEATAAADVGTADYEEQLQEESGETTAGSTNGDKTESSSNPRPGTLA